MNEFDSNIGRYLDGDDDARLVESIDRKLSEDPDNVLRFAKAAMLDTELQDLASARRVSASVGPGTTAAPAQPQRSAPSIWRSGAYAIAATIALAAVSVAIYLVVVGGQSSEPTPAGVPIATLIDATHTVVYEDDIARSGAEYASGSYSIESGSAQFLLTSRVSVDLQGPTRLFMHSGMAVSLQRGEARFNCPPNARGFTVHLPDQSKIVDLGTAFRVSADPEADGTSVVRVTEGRVRVDWSDAQGTERSIVLAAGERAWVKRNPEAGTTVTRLVDETIVLIDFGRAASSIHGNNATSGGDDQYNNIEQTEGDGATTGDVPLVDTFGLAVGWSINVTEDGNGRGGNSAVQADTSQFPDELAAYPATALADTVFASGTTPAMTVTVSGLDDRLSYDLLFYGSRANEQNITDQTWRLTRGSGAADVVHESEHNADTVVDWRGVRPDADGVIAFTITGSGKQSGALALNFGRISQVIAQPNHTSPEKPR